MGKEWSAPEIMQLSGGYWSGCALQAGVQLDLFTLLAESPCSEDDLAGRLACDPRAVGMLVTALVALGFLERRDGRVHATEAAAHYLSSASDDYLGYLIKHHAFLLPAWSRLAEAVRTGRPPENRLTMTTTDPGEREAFLMGMFNVARQQAGQIAQILDLSGRRGLLDVGGGPGTYAVYFCLENPNLRATVFDLPSTEPFARRVIDRYALGDRIDFVGGDYLDGPLPQGHDVVWLSQVLHGENPEDAARLVGNAARSVRPGGMVCIQEFALEDDRSGPVHPALFALNMLLETEGGQGYAKGEIAVMLREAGASRVRELQTPLPMGCTILIGDMP